MLDRLAGGDLLPKIRTAKRGAPEAAELERFEAPGINTLIAGKTDLVLSEALGANVLDTRGNRLIDLVCGFGVNILGHRHPAVSDAIATQANRLVHGLGDVYANPPRIELARSLSRLAPYRDPQVYFAVSGADAIEVALKTAVLRTGKRRVLAFDPGYHGLTLGALQVSSRSDFREPFAGHSGDHVVRLPYACDPDRVGEVLQGGDFAAVVFEPVVGREGVLFPPRGWVQDVLKAAQGTDTLSIADEIFTGLKRTGSWFAHLQTSSSEPRHADLICCGKALGGGLPIGAVVAERSTFACWDRGGEALHTGTFVAHPLACAAGVAVLNELEQPWVDQRVLAIDRALSDLQESPLAAGVVDVRGRGALWALETQTRNQADHLRKALLADGVLTLAGGPSGRVLQLVPPLCITDRQLKYVTEALARAMDLLG